MIKILEWVAGGFGALLGILVSMFGRKAVIGSAAVVAFVSLLIAFIICMKVILSGVIALIAIPPWLFSFLGMFIPSNTIACFAGILSAKTCRAAYDAAKHKIDLLIAA